MVDQPEGPFWYWGVYNLLPEVRGETTFPERVEICDLTLDEDGEGMAGAYMTEEDKLSLAEMLDEIGIHRIGVLGFPSPISREEVAATKPEIQKLTQYWDTQQPSPWQKVYDLSDHVRFTHTRHVKAGIECQTCHGPVETMAVIRLQQDLTMGFCVRCHKQRLNDKHTPASLDCATCHR